MGIGASAGGLDAIKLFLQALPQKTRMAFVFVQHLSPTHVSILPGILEKISPIPVIPITDGVTLKPDHFYISPENTAIKAVDFTLKLEPAGPVNKKANSIDSFFS